MDQQLQNARILIVDDDYTNVLLAERTLKQVGFENLKGITDPLKVAGLLVSFKPDIILLDLHMPGLDGFGVMRLLKAECDPVDFLPILVLTADASQDTKRNALTAGASDFLTKPFDLFEVMLRTRNLLRLRFIHCELRTQNARLEEKVQQRTRDLEDAYIEVFERLAKVSETRDDDTGEHTKRVGAMAERIAMVLGLPQSDAERIGLAAQLHDVGKTSIPDEILLKPGKLTANEFEVMKKHAVMGVEILAGSRSPVLKLAEQIALTHHERWSGGGYPNGLSGEQIPLVGRIVAVCDVFDALTHERTYKRAWPMQEAMSEIRRLSGQHFDPQVVDALFEVLTNAGLCLKAA